MEQFNDTNLLAGVILFLGSFATLAIVISAIVGILQLIAHIKIFKKAGEPGWKVIVPIYNVYIPFKLFWKPAMFLVILVLSIAFGVLASFSNLACQLIALVVGITLIVLQIKYCAKMSKAFGMGNGFAAGLFFLPFIFTLILAFGKAQYVGNPCCTEAAVEVETPVAEVEAPAEEVEAPAEEPEAPAETNE